MKSKMLFYMSCILYFLSSFVMFLTPFIYYNPNCNVSFILGLCFWGLLLFGTVLQIMFIVSIPKIEKPHKPSFLQFAANRPALIADCVLIISTISTFIFLIFQLNIWLIQAITAFFMLLSFEFHFVFNSYSFNYFSKSK